MALKSRSKTTTAPAPVENTEPDALDPALALVFGGGMTDDVIVFDADGNEINLSAEPDAYADMTRRLAS
jgi:hypothetical protein